MDPYVSSLICVMGLVFMHYLMHIFQTSTPKLCLVWTSPRQWQRKDFQKEFRFSQDISSYWKLPSESSKPALPSMGKVLIQYPWM